MLRWSRDAGQLLLLTCALFWLSLLQSLQLSGVQDHVMATPSLAHWFASLMLPMLLRVGSFVALGHACRQDHGLQPYELAIMLGT